MEHTHPHTWNRLQRRVQCIVRDVELPSRNECGIVSVSLIGRSLGRRRRGLLGMGVRDGGVRVRLAPLRRSPTGHIRLGVYACK